ncbi:MAG: sulfite exporter TauE/SafE family protein [Firmicutes bacterium]|nr:sulfite exporter TauE/SafE family protein [Bacillota bacterium]
MELLLFITGVIAGIFAGMGMGGGTLLIPMLTLFFAMGQKSAQAINLVAFLPMALVALYIHNKNGLVQFKRVWVIIVFALAFTILGSVLANSLDDARLSGYFGLFIMGLGIYQLTTIIIKWRKNKSSNTGQVNPQSENQNTENQTRVAEH